MAGLTQAKIIGEMIKDARLKNGYDSRAQLVGTKKIRARLTQEGLRKIEHGQRVPRLENIRLLAATLGISERKTKQMERLALEANVQRVTRRAGNANVTFQIEGRPIKMFALPPHAKTETFVRETVGELVKLIDRYGVMSKDVEHFRRHARNVLLKRMA